MAMEPVIGDTSSHLLQMHSNTPSHLSPSMAPQQKHNYTKEERVTKEYGDRSSTACKSLTASYHHHPEVTTDTKPAPVGHVSHSHHYCELTEELMALPHVANKMATVRIGFWRTPPYSLILFLPLLQNVRVQLYFCEVNPCCCSETCSEDDHGTESPHVSQ